VVTGMDSPDQYQTNAYFKVCTHWSSACSTATVSALTREIARVSIGIYTESVASSLQILDGEAEGLLGIQSAIGRYELDAEKADRQIVWFEAIRIAPADKDPASLERWLSVFKEANPSMVSCSALGTVFLKAVFGSFPSQHLDSTCYSAGPLPVQNQHYTEHIRDRMWGGQMLVTCL
jgi:hypothetical protein